jgi:hypothetical protein
MKYIRMRYHILRFVAVAIASQLVLASTVKRDVTQGEEATTGRLLNKLSYSPLSWTPPWSSPHALLDLARLPTVAKQTGSSDI